MEHQPEQKAVVWDLDGVIVDSAEAHNASWVAMAREFGVPYDPRRDFARIFGRHNTDIIGSMWNVKDPEQIQRMAEVKERWFRKYAASLRPLPGVIELMEELARSGWKQAIGSSAPMENIRLLVSAAGVDKYMQAIVSGDDVSKGKPDPQVFLMAFERLGVDPRNGVVIEDAPAGIQAGLRAGAATVGVATTQPPEVLREAGAHLVVNSLTELSLRDLEELVQRQRRRLSNVQSPSSR
jgi:beta-phosphoglucomutase